MDFRRGILAPELLSRTVPPSNGKDGELSSMLPAPSSLPNWETTSTVIPHDCAGSISSSFLGSSFSGSDGPGGKQRRRRTSPEDHAILEAAYAKNPKPDKSFRVEIVKQVALGEKEVQIWFQNRRQMTRRRSQNTQQTTTADDDHGQTSSQETTTSSFVSTSTHVGNDGMDVKSSQSSVVEEADRVSADVCILKKDTGANQRESTSSSLQKQGIEVVRAGDTVEPVKAGEGPQSTTPPAVGSKFLVPPVSAPVTSPHQGVAVLASSLATASPRRSPHRRISNVRLSLTLDGKAEVTDVSSPLPSSLPKFNARSSLGLQRSQSAVEPKQSLNPAFVLPPLSNPTRGRHGRSRDARTWEFFCDGGDADDALTKRAEGEQAGSAASAISLIRQNSASSLRLNAAKRNAARERDESCKRIKGNVKKDRTKLHRTQSSVARLQTSSEKSSLKAGESSLLDPWASGDSDKENWLPGTTHTPLRKAAPAPQVAGVNRGILRENMHLPSHSSSLDALLNSAKNTPKRQNKAKEVSTDEDLKDRTSDSQDAEDLDCVQGLLSLSQGAWH